METFAPESHGAILRRGYPIKPEFQVVEDPRELGNVKSIAIAQKALRRYQLEYLCRDRTAYEYIDSFVHFQVGPAGRFSYVLPEFVSTPFGVPLLSAISGGTQGSRTIRVQYAWQTDLGRTRASTVGVLAVPANNLLKVTLRVFPPSVVDAVIYATEGGSGTEQEQAVVQALTWTQPDAALLTGTAAPLTTNTAREMITAKFVAGSYEVVRLIGAVYNVTLGIEEAYAA